ncbi:MAG: large-conductance mechanosensitive channel protein MscL [Clostridia bacterium]|nr:large-conductance mechanosensitive channel protein MscL [Clostridia bacterium]
MGFFKEFKEFAMKGNVIDMAVGVVIGAAFGKIVTSLVNDIVLPPIGLAIGGVEFSELKAVLKEGKAAVVDADGVETAKAVEEVAIRYGNLIQVILEFIIIALCIFLVVRTINKIKAKSEAKKAAAEAAEAAAKAEAEAAAAAEEAAKPTETDLLVEIRDLLKERS